MNWPKPGSVEAQFDPIVIPKLSRKGLFLQRDLSKQILPKLHRGPSSYNKAPWGMESRLHYYFCMIQEVNPKSLAHKEFTQP